MKFFASKTQTAAKGKSSKGKSKAKPEPVPAKPLLTLDQWLDMAGIGLMLLALISILAILTPTKGVLGNLVDSYTQLFGLGQYIAPLLLGFIGFYLIVRHFGDKFPHMRVGAVAGVVLAFVCLLVTMHAVGTITKDGEALSLAGEGGGAIGWGILHTLDQTVGNLGAAIFMLVGWFVAFMLMSNISMAELVLRIEQQVSNRSGRGPSDDVITPPWDRGRDDDKNGNGSGFTINWNRTKKKADERARDERPR